jgi:hypothetical protein
MMSWPGAAAPAGVTPATLTATVNPGQSVTFATQVEMASPPSLDIAFVQDTTGDMATWVGALQADASAVASDLRAAAPDAEFALASHDDFPYSTYGAIGDVPYALHQTMTASTSAFAAAVNGLAVHNGLDAPESQIPALYKTLTGTPLTWPTGSVAATTPPAGTFGDVGFRDSAQPVIVLLSHGPFHNSKKVGDTTYQDTYSFATYNIDDVVSKLNSTGTRFVGIVEGSDADGFDYLVAHTTGGVNETAATGSGLQSAIETGIFSLPWQFTASASGCGGMQVALPPARSALRGDIESFDVTLSVPAGTPPGTIACAIDYAADGQTFVSQPVSITVPGTSTTGSRLPTVASVSPSRGPRTGGTKVTVTGTGLTGATAVRFGSHPASRFAVVSDTTITAVAPPHAAGTVDISVTNPAGQSATTATARFKFVRVCIVPKLKGKTLNAAKKALKKADCSLGDVKGPAMGKVKHQSPGRGTILPTGTKVSIRLV